MSVSAFFNYVRLRLIGDRDVYYAAFLGDLVNRTAAAAGQSPQSIELNTTINHRSPAPRHVAASGRHWLSNTSNFKLVEHPRQLCCCRGCPF